MWRPSLILTSLLVARSSGLQYALNRQLIAVADSCIYPANFTVVGFRTFEPAVGNPESPNLRFDFVDAATNITTLCQWNSTSQSTTNGTGLAARYPCNDRNVSFIWVPSNDDPAQRRLTMIETVCPGKTT
jgi:hypothetical protein